MLASVACVSQDDDEALSRLAAVAAEVASSEGDPRELFDAFLEVQGYCQLGAVGSWRWVSLPTR